jgi:carboxypeptidase D
MVPFDVPHISHDMMLRFMGVNFSAITEGSALIPSKVGDEEKPIFAPGGVKDNDGKTSQPPKTPEQDKAMWEGK